MQSSTAENSLLSLGEGELPEWAPKDLSGKHLVMCEYHLAGMTHSEIGTVLGYHPAYVGMVLRGAPARAYIKQRVQDLSDELHGQYHQVIKNMQDGLAHANFDVRMRATEMWLKAHGRFSTKVQGEKGPVSAEDVVAKLLENAKHVNVHIDNRQYNGGAPPTLDNYEFLEEEK